MFNQWQVAHCRSKIGPMGLPTSSNGTSEPDRIGDSETNLIFGEHDRPSMHENDSSPFKLPHCPSVAHPDRMRAKQHYGCFPEYSYNTAFGSLFTGGFGRELIDGEELQADIPPVSSCIPSLHLPWRIPDEETSPSNMWNNSAWIDSCPTVFEPNCVGDAPASDHVRLLTADLIQHLIQFLNEFLPFLSSIVDGQVRICQIQRSSMMNVFQHLLRLRADLLTDVNNYAKCPMSVSSFDIATVSIILQQLTALLRHLTYQEQCSTSTIHRDKLIQWGDQLEGLMAASMSIMDASSNEAISLPTIPAIDSFAGSQSLPIADGFPNLCIPWPVLEPVRNLSVVNCPLESTCGMEDEIRSRKTRKSKRRDPEYMLDYPENGQAGLADHLIKSTSKRTPFTSSQERSRMTSPQSTAGLVKSDGYFPLSIRSILTKTIQQKTGLGSALQSKSNANSKQSSPLLRTTSADDQSDSTNSAQQSFGLNRSSPFDPTVSPSTMDAVPQSPADTSSAWSHQTYAYRSPSRMTPGVTHGSEQNLSSGHEKSIVGQPSTLDSYSSANLAAREKESIRSFTLANTPAALTTRSALNEQFEPNDGRGLNSWEQRMGSPSIQSINHTPSRQNALLSNLNSPFPINDTESDLNFDGYSNNPRSPAINMQLNQSTGQPVQLNVIEGPRSAEGTSSVETSSLRKPSPKQMNTEYSPANRKDLYRQQSASATSSSDQSFTDEHRKRDVTRAHLNRSRKRRKNEPPPVSHQGYFDKFMTCVRRTLVNRMDRSQYRKQ